MRNKLVYFFYFASYLLASTTMASSINSDFVSVPQIDLKSFGLMANLKSTFRSNLMADPSKLKLAWPLEDKTHTLLTRFGTPTLVSITGSGRSPFKMDYLHEALDIKRSSQDVSDLVHSPVSGQAIIQYDAAPGLKADSYSTAVAILDDESKLVVAVLHIEPDTQLLNELRFTHIKRGQVIGHIGELDEAIKFQYKNEFKHVHLMVVDEQKDRYLNPIAYVDSYEDTVAPTTKTVYLLDQSSQRHDNLVSGKVSIVLEAYDRDNFSQRNFEISALQYEIHDDEGRVLQQTAKCNLDIFTEPIFLKVLPANLFLDLDSSLTQANTNVFEFKTDAGNPDRTFKYLISNIVSSSSSCSLKKMKDFLVIPDGIKELKVIGEIFDLRGNKTSFSKTFSR